MAFEEKVEVLVIGSQEDEIDICYPYFPVLSYVLRVSDSFSLVHNRCGAI